MKPGLLLRSDFALVVEVETGLSSDKNIFGPPSFPVETWEAIFRNVIRAGDLYNVCLTSRYVRDVATPILYRRLYLDPNLYLIYTLDLFRRQPTLTNRVTELTLLAPVSRVIPLSVHEEVVDMVTHMDIPPTCTTPEDFSTPQPLLGGDIQQLEAELCFSPVLHFFPTFTHLAVLNIKGQPLPRQLLSHIFSFPHLLVLCIQDSIISATLDSQVPAKPLPLKDLSITGCTTKADLTVFYVPGILCEGLIRHSPLLTSLSVDLLLEYTACTMLSELDVPPPIQFFKCQGMTHHDPNCTLLCSVLTALPTITSLCMARTPRELAPLLPLGCLPNLRSITGPIKSVAVFISSRRPLQYLTITDSALSTAGAPWELLLIQFLENLKRIDTDIKGLAFNVAEWSEEIFLCVCQLWPGLKELRIQCTRGKGVDEYFRISFGPRFLPQLQSLELLHIFERRIKHGFSEVRPIKGAPVSVSPCRSPSLEAEETEELAEAPVHLRRWERLCPSLREVAFDREAWWRRIEPGGWALNLDRLPALVEDSG